MSSFFASAGRRRTSHCLVLAALVVGSVLVWTPAPAASASSVTVRNGSFERGLNGWRHSAARGVRTKVVRAGVSGSRAVRMTAGRRSKVVLSHKKPVVRSTSRGASYRATAWVRASKRTVKTELQLREQGRGRTITHRKKIKASAKKWRKVVLATSTKRSGARLGLRVVGLARRQSLLVDGITVVRVRAAATGPRACGARRVSQRGIASCGALFGAAVGSNTDPAGFESQVGGRLGVRRTFWTAAQGASAAQTARTDIAQGRQPWVSFKVPYSWEQMAAGRGDAWARDIATKLRSAGGPVWVAFHHEPEGDGNIKAWTAMQRRLAPIVRAQAPNVAYSIILTGWNQLYGAAAYRLDAMWPHGTTVDIAGFDIYNHYGLTKSGRTVTKHTAMRRDYFEPISKWARSKGVAWGLAETGYTDAAHRSDPAWLSRTYAELDRSGGIAFSYFNTNLNSTGSWVITTSAKRSAFARALKGSPRPR